MSDLEFEDVDMLGVFELALRGSREIIDERRDALASYIDQHDAFVELRNLALEIATQGDGRDVTVDALYAPTEGDEVARARLRALFSRASALPIPQPTTT